MAPGVRGGALPWERGEQPPGDVVMSEGRGLTPVLFFHFSIYFKQHMKISQQKAAHQIKKIALNDPITIIIPATLILFDKTKWYYSLIP